MIHAFKDDSESGKVVVHRNFPGDHEDSETCWCRPEVIDPDLADESTADEIVERLERADG